MTNDSHIHRPTEKFRSALEWEISQALRREVKSASQMRSGRPKRFLFTGSLAATLAIGVVLGAAPAQIQDAKQRDSLTAAARADLQLAVARLQLAERRFALEQARVNRGMVVREALAAPQASLAAAQSALAAVNLNLEEIKASSATPRDDLSAPLVGQRDFATERLQLAMTTLESALASAEQEFALADRRMRVGAGSPLELQDARTALVQAKAHLEVVVGKIALRQRFLKERMAPAEVALRAQLIEAQQELVIAQPLLSDAEERYRFVTTQEKLGMVDRTEVLKAELDVLSRQADIRLITARLKSIESSLKGRGG